MKPPDRITRFGKRVRRPEALRWIILLVLVWIVYLSLGGSGFTLPVLIFSALMALLVMDEVFFTF